MKEMAAVIVPGKTTNDLLAFFGQPHDTDDLGNGRVVWCYFLAAFPASDDMRGSFVTGVNITTTNGRIADWSAIYTGHLPRKASKGSLPRTTEANHGANLAFRPSLAIFLVSKERTPDGQKIPFQSFSNIGYMPTNPAIRIASIKLWTIDEQPYIDSRGSKHARWSFTIVLHNPDAALLEAFTRTNVGRQVLLTLSGEAVAAPVIMMPISTGSLVIDVENRALMKKLQTQIAAMQNDPPR